MDSDEEAGTAASLDHIIARLQALETADQVRNASDLPLVVNVRSGVVHRVVGDPSKPTARQLHRCTCTSPVTLFAENKKEGREGGTPDGLIVVLL